MLTPLAPAVASLGVARRKLGRLRGRGLQRRNARLLRAAPLCDACRRVGRVREAVEVDHIMALADGGSDRDEANLQTLCREHHDEKSAAEAAARARGDAPAAWSAPARDDDSRFVLA
jgi:5-methylcytosine-specific restriction protein A